MSVGLTAPRHPGRGRRVAPRVPREGLLPCLTKIEASGAQAVITGYWGNDLTLLVKAAKELGFEDNFYTFYGNVPGAPAVLELAK